LGYTIDRKTGKPRRIYRARQQAPAEQLGIAEEDAAPSGEAPGAAPGGEGSNVHFDPEGRSPVRLSEESAYRLLLADDSNAPIVYANPVTNQVVFASLDYVHGQGAPWGKGYRFTTFQLIQLEEPAIQVLVSSCTCSSDANWPGEPGDRFHQSRIVRNQSRPDA